MPAAALTSAQSRVREAALTDFQTVHNAAGPGPVSVSENGAMRGEVGGRIDALGNTSHSAPVPEPSPLDKGTLLVNSGMRCDDACKVLGVDPWREVGVALQMHALKEFGEARVRAGEGCDQVCASLGIANHEKGYKALEEFAAEAVGRQLVRDGQPCDVVAKALGIPSSSGANDTLQRNAVEDLGQRRVLAGEACDVVARSLGLPKWDGAYKALQHFAVEQVGKARVASTCWAASTIADQLGLVRSDAAYRELIRYADTEGIAARAAFLDQQKAGGSEDKLAPPEPVSETKLSVVTLPDGSRYPESTVRTVWVNLEAFVERTTAIDTYELHQKCLDPKHEMFGNSGQQAEKYSLISDGRMHDDVRSIILASLHGDGLQWELKNPLG